jgi:Protein of unknown function (DUF3105)
VASVAHGRGGDHSRRGMPTGSHGDGLKPAGRKALVAYALGWVVPAAVIVGTALAILHDGEETVALPPVQETELTSAAFDAGCVLRRGRSARGSVPVDGGPAQPAKPGVYDATPSTPALVAAMRRGVVIIHYAPDLPETDVEQLRTVQESAPKGTLVTPNEHMPYRVAVTAYRRLLGCDRFDGQTADALQLFRGRYVGAGPD